MCTSQNDYAMKHRLLPRVLLAALMMYAAAAIAQTPEFSFGVIPHAFQNSTDEMPLHDAIAGTNRENLAFVVVNGIKSSKETCDDALYDRRKNLLNTAENGVVISLAASDWTECKNAKAKSAAIERLNRLREVFFTDDFSLGASKIPLVRQSSSAKFRSYAENARWELATVLFATVNLPKKNNHYRSEAGRNSEFEDRLIANRDWLDRLFSQARRRKLDGIVLFCDANPLELPNQTQLSNYGTPRDGFAETRHLITGLAAKFAGKVLLVHSQHRSPSGTEPVIVWHDNLGTLGVDARWIEVAVHPGSSALFSVGDYREIAKSAQK